MADNYLSEQEQLRQWYVTQARAMGQAAGTALQMQGMEQAQLQAGLFNSPFSVGIGQAQSGSDILQWRGALGGLGMGNQPGMSHLGTVRDFRRKFKEYTKAEFREMGSRPVIKEILSGMTKLNKEQIQERIAEHLAAV